jgi:hypothetical protein
VGFSLSSKGGEGNGAAASEQLDAFREQRGRAHSDGMAKIHPWLGKPAAPAWLSPGNCHFLRIGQSKLSIAAGLDFETKIMVKEDAPKLLRAELAAPGWIPKVIALSGVTDPYQPVERRLKLTRGCLEVLAEFRNPVTTMLRIKIAKP